MNGVGWDTGARCALFGFLRDKGLTRPAVAGAGAAEVETGWKDWVAGFTGCAG